MVPGSGQDTLAFAHAVAGVSAGGGVASVFSVSPPGRRPAPGAPRPGTPSTPPGTGERKSASRSRPARSGGRAAPGPSRAGVPPRRSHGRGCPPRRVRGRGPGGWCRYPRARSERACRAPPGTAGPWCRSRSRWGRARRGAAGRGPPIAVAQSVSTSRPFSWMRGRVGGLSAVQALGPRRPWLTRSGAPAHPDDASVLDREVQAVIAVQERRALHSPSCAQTALGQGADADPPGLYLRARTASASPTARRACGMRPPGGR